MTYRVWYADVTVAWFSIFGTHTRVVRTYQRLLRMHTAFVTTSLVTKLSVNVSIDGSKIKLDKSAIKAC